MPLPVDPNFLYGCPGDLHHCDVTSLILTEPAVVRHYTCAAPRNESGGAAGRVLFAERDQTGVGNEGSRHGFLDGLFRRFSGQVFKQNSVQRAMEGSNLVKRFCQQSLESIADSVAEHDETLARAMIRTISWGKDRHAGAAV